MDQCRAAFSGHADAVPDGMIERMQRVDSLVRQWVDPAFRALIDPDAPEVVGQPSHTPGRIHHRV